MPIVYYPKHAGGICALAKKLDVARQTVSRWLKRKSTPRAQHLEVMVANGWAAIVPDAPSTVENGEPRAA